MLARTKKNYSDEILKMLDDIRSPYALSLVCITLGFIAEEKSIPLLMKKFEDFKKHYPNENYEEGPLYGLIKMNERFYHKQ